MPEERVNVSYSDLAGLLSSHNLDASTICQLTPSIASDIVGRNVNVNSVQDRIQKIPSQNISAVNSYKNEYTFRQLDSKFD